MFIVHRYQACGMEKILHCCCTVSTADTGRPAENTMRKLTLASLCPLHYSLFENTLYSQIHLYPANGKQQILVWMSESLRKTGCGCGCCFAQPSAPAD